MSKDGKLDLDVFVVEFQAAGQAWVAAKLKADQLTEDRKSFLAAIQNELEKTSQEKLTEARLERWALGSNKYRVYIKQMCEAQAEALSKRVRYDALDKLFEAKRSGLSFEKEIIKKGIFHSGE